MGAMEIKTTIKATILIALFSVFLEISPKKFHKLPNFSFDIVFTGYFVPSMEKKLQIYNNRFRNRG